jgi:hypothetical protein
MDVQLGSVGILDEHVGAVFQLATRLDDALEGAPEIANLEVDGGGEGGHLVALRQQDDVAIGVLGSWGGKVKKL